MVLFKRHPVSSAKTTLKPPFFLSRNILHQSSSKNKRGEDAASEAWTRTSAQEASSSSGVGGQLPAFFEIGGEMKNAVVPPDFFARRCLFMRQLFAFIVAPRRV